jgi:hypothetical protein
LLAALVAPGPGGLARWLEKERLDGTDARWLRAQGLAPYTFYRLREAGLLNDLPDKAQLELRSAYYQAAAETELHRCELTMVLEVLASVNILPVLFKGAALAYTVYPDPVCRPMGDLDLWVTTDEMPLAQIALGRLGYVAHAKPGRPQAFQMRNHGEVQMAATRPGSGLVELHGGVFPGEWLRRTAQVDDAGLCARAVSATLAGWPARVLSPEDGVIQLAVHMAINHNMAYPWLRGLVDIVLLAQAQSVDWKRVVARARDWRVSTATWLVLQLAADLAGLGQVSWPVTELAPSLLRRWLLSCLVDAESMAEMRNLTAGPLRFVYLLLMVDRARDALHLLSRALWPEREWLQARYGQTGPAMQLRHLAGAVRGEI